MKDFNSGMHSSNTGEWSTPDDVYSEIEHRWGPFTLDPCATAENARASKFFTVVENGLRQDWTGERVFMNPPYGRPIRNWVEKAATSGAYVVCLIPARTDTRWWQQWIGSGYPWKAHEVFFWNGRIHFGGSAERGHNAPFPSAVIVFQPEYEAIKWTTHSK